MLELLDTGRLAVKYGRWRGLVAACWSLFPAACAFGLAKLEGVLLRFFAAAGHDEIPPLAWGSLGMALFAYLLVVWAAWQLYRDHVHGDYYMDAEHYRDHGW